MKTSLQEIRVYLNAYHDVRGDEAVGRELAQKVRQLQFRDKGGVRCPTTEPRGLSDTGLTNEDFVRIVGFNLPDGLHAEICDYLYGG